MEVDLGQDKHSIDQEGQRSVSPDLDPNCLRRLSADNKSLLARKEVGSMLHTALNSQSMCKKYWVAA